MQLTIFRVTLLLILGLGLIVVGRSAAGGEFFNFFTAVIMASSRLPTPSFVSGQSYELYKKEVAVWEKCTSIAADQRALHLLLSLPGKDKDKTGIKDKLLETFKIDEIKVATGVQLLLVHMDKYLAKDTLLIKWEHFEEFECYEKKDSESMAQYIANFDTLYEKLKSNVSETLSLPSSILAFKLLRGAKLTEEQRLVVMSGMDFDDETKLYQTAQKSLKKFFGGAATGGAVDDIRIKSEPVFYSNAGYRGRGRTRGGFANSNQTSRSAGVSYSRQNSASSAGPKRQKDLNPRNREGVVLRCYRCDSYRHMGSNCPGEGKINPKGKDGQTMRCLVCESYRHVMNECPHSWEAMAKDIKFVSDHDYDDSEDFFIEIEPCSEPVVLFTRNDSDLNLLNKESYFCGVLDSGCSSTVCGKKWLQVYLDRLTDEQRASVTREPSGKIFQFGGELRVPSEGHVVIPGQIAGTPVLINTDVVDSNIPLLFSKDALKSMKAKIDYGTDEAVILGKPLLLTKTSVGHHCLQLLPETVDVHAAVILNNLTSDQKFDVILKLHRQYGHPGKVTLIKHLKTAGVWDEECAPHVDKIYTDCNICKQYSRTPSRPVVSLPMASEFNELVAMDLKYWKPNLWILHMVDVFSRFSQSVFITSKKPGVIIEAILANWVGVFGVMSRGVLTDNGGEFCNEDMREMSSLLNIELLTTAAFAPFQNGLCERNHAVIDMMLYKLQADYRNVSLSVLLKWANMAKNSIQMWSGYSSYQIVFGSNPNLPNVLTDRVPALQDGTANQVYTKHISVLHAARREFVKTEACERIKRALRSRVRATETNFETGDKVFYKRSGSNKWLGPAKVIGQDGKIVFAIHGGHLVRVATSRLLVASNSGVAQGSDFFSDSTEVPIVKDMPWTGAYEAIEPEASDASEPEAVTPVISAIEPEASDASEPEAVTSVISAVEPEASDATDTVSADQAKMSRALSRLLPFNNPGFSEILSDDEQVNQVEQVYSVTVPNSEHNNPECCEAKQQELDRLQQFDVYEEVVDEGQSCISTRWVVVRKGPDRVKARLVARGFEESLSEAVDSPTISKPCVRMVLAIAASNKWTIQSTDVKSAFLQGQNIERDVYLKPPKESSTPQGKVWKLRRCLYGLNDAARQFYNSLSKELLNIGCQRSGLDPALFMFFHNSHLAGVLVSHVDDSACW